MPATGDVQPERPPLGSWSKTYLLACVLAVVVILLLWWLSVAYAPPRGPA